MGAVVIGDCVLFLFRRPRPCRIGTHAAVALLQPPTEALSKARHERVRSRSVCGQLVRVRLGSSPVYLTPTLTPTLTLTLIPTLTLRSTETYAHSSSCVAPQPLAARQGQVPMGSWHLAPPTIEPPMATIATRSPVRSRLKTRRYARSCGCRYRYRSVEHLEWQTLAGWHATRPPVERCHLRRAQVVPERHAVQFGGREDARGWLGSTALLAERAPTAWLLRRCRPVQWHCALR